MANFRRNLIEKIIVDDGKAVADKDTLNEVLRTSSEGDNSKLMSYAWRHVIPASQRVTLYKQLLGVSGCYQETRDIVARHREEEVGEREARVLLRCLETMKTYHGSYTEDDQPLPTSWDIVKMILLARGQLSQAITDIGVNYQDCKEPGVQEVVAITNQVCLMSPDNWIDAFCIARRLVELLDKILDQQTLQATVQQIRHRVNNCRDLVGHVEWRKIDLQFWLRSCMCGIVSCDRTIFQIFDKVVTGQCVVPLLRSLAVSFAIQHINIGKIDSSVQQRCAAQAIESTWREVKGGKGNRVQQGSRPWTVDVEEPELRPISYHRQSVA